MQDDARQRRAEGAAEHDEANEYRTHLSSRVAAFCLAAGSIAMVGFAVAVTAAAPLPRLASTVYLLSPCRLPSPGGKPSWMPCFRLRADADERIARLREAQQVNYYSLSLPTPWLARAAAIFPASALAAPDRSPFLNPRLINASVACPDCDLLQRVPPLPAGGRASCMRCGATLARQPSGPSDLPLALTVTAAIVFIIANTSPLMDLSAVARTANKTIVGGAYQMWLEDERITGVLVGFCAVIAPGSYLAFMLTLLLASRRSPAPFWISEMLRWVEHFKTWSMLEVMLLGILVALIKIAELATVDPGIGMYAVGGLVLLIPAILVTFDDRELWQRLEWVDGETPPPPEAEVSR